MSVNLLFLNNADMDRLGAGDMQAAIHDVERAYVLVEQGDVLVPGKCVMRWGSTPEDENVLGRINAMLDISAANTIWPASSGSAADLRTIRRVCLGPV